MTAESPSPSVQVILTPLRTRLITRILKRQSPHPVTGWIYLGNNPAESIRLDEVFGRSVPKVSIADRLQDAAQRYRHLYIDYIGALTMDHCGIPWFLTSFSEKNPFASHFFHSFCSIVACREYLATAPGTVIVVCGSPGIQDALATNLRASHFSRVISCRDTLRSFLDGVTTRLLGTGRKFWFIARYAFRIVVAHLVQPRGIPREDSLSREPVALIHAWTDQRSFREPGSYWDIFYGDLLPILSRDFRVRYIIDVLPTMGYLRALSHLMRLDQFQCILQERFLSPFDLHRASLARRRGYRDLAGMPLLDGMQVGPLIDDEKRLDSLTTRGEQSYLCYRAARRIAALHPSSPYFYTFENHMWEKCTIEGIREASSRATVVGYAHTLVYPMNLSYSLSCRETACTPLPDLILTNGRQPRDMLIEAGFPESRIHVCGALRYGTLRQSRGVLKEKGGHGILVAGSVSTPRTIELIHKALQAFAENPDTPVWIKCHPNLPFSCVERMLPPLPPHFAVREEPVETLFPATGIVLFTESTVAVEAAACGIPVIHVRLDCSLDMNIFEGIRMIPSLGSPGEIRHAAMMLQGQSLGEVPEIRKFIGTLFGEVDPDRIRALVHPDHPPDPG